jgi:uncharacterized protein DUF4118
MNRTGTVSPIMRNWVVAVVRPLAVSGILVGFRGDFAATNAALILVLVVLAAAMFGGRGPGLLGAVISAACFDFFFTRPYYSFTINNRDDIELTVVLLVVALAVGELVVRAQRSERSAVASRRQVDQMRRVAQVASGGEPMGHLIDVVQREVVAVLGARGSRFERPPFRTRIPTLHHDRVTLPADGTGKNQPPGPGNEVALPLWGHGREIGRIVVVLPRPSVGVDIPADDRLIAVALVDQLGALLAAEREVGGGDDAGPA